MPHPATANLLAAALDAHRRGDLDRCIPLLRQIVQLDPDDPAAAVMLGSLLRSRRLLDESETVLRACIARHPSVAEAHANLGVTLGDQGRNDQAIAYAREAVRLRPDQPLMHSNLCYALHCDPEATPQSLLAEHRAWADRHAGPIPQLPSWTGDRSPDRPLRIGYVSRDFCRHPVGRFLLPLLAHHDRSRFTAVCYSSGDRRDEMTTALQNAAREWRDCRALDDAALADRVREDRIDVLIDLSLHTVGHRLPAFARKPAPVQISWLGYPSTTGLPQVDFRFSDRFLDPPGTGDDCYTERTIRLRSYWCYPPPTAPAVRETPALRRGSINFGCLNNFVKVNPPLIRLWATVLQRVENSTMVLHCKPGRHWRATLDLFAAAGVDPGRVQYVGYLPAESYFAQYHNLDIALDTTPYAGGTTTCDALFMGVPVVTIRGGTAVGRMGVSILGQIGHDQWVAENGAEYVEIAVSLAADPMALNEIRQALRRRVIESPLMDATGFTAGFEAGLREAWRTVRDAEQL